MKKILLAGSAVIALAALSGAAAAQEIKTGNLSLTIEGSLQFNAAYVDEDNEPAGGARATEFETDTEIEFTFTGKADNGLEYGANVELEADPGNTNVADEVYGFVRGQFGEIQFGNKDGASVQLGVYAPADFGTGGIDGDFANFVTEPGPRGTHRYFSDYLNPLTWDEEDFTKVTYFTPSFAGVTAGISYTPRVNSQGQQVTRLKTDNTYEDVVDLSANYAREFGDVALKLSGSYMLGRAVLDTGEDLRSWYVGASVGYAGFLVGGGYGDFGKIHYANTPLDKTLPGRSKAHAWNAGIQYTVGAITAGANYLSAEDEGDQTVAANDKLEAVSVGVTYTVAPGFATYVEYTHSEQDADTAANDQEANVFILGSKISF